MAKQALDWLNVDPSTLSEPLQTKLKALHDAQDDVSKLKTDFVVAFCTFAQKRGKEWTPETLAVSTRDAFGGNKLSVAEKEPRAAKKGAFVKL